MSDATAVAYTEKDMVEVVDAAGMSIPGMPVVPKKWLGTNLVPAGTQKGSPSSDLTPSASKAVRTSRASGEEPPRGGAGSGQAEWVAYAKEKGATDEDLLDDKGEELSQQALIEKYGAASA